MGDAKRIAVLIGNSVYPEFPKDELDSLSTPLNDIDALKKTLEDPSRGNFKSVTCLADKDALSVQDAIEETIIEAAKTDSLALIFYSGHGILDPTNRLHLVTHDSKPGRYTSTLTLSRIAEYVNVHSPQKLVVLLDCCYSGAGLRDFELKGSGIATGRRFEIDRTVTQTFGSLEGKGIVIVTATNSIQQAKANKKCGFGIFTRHVLDGLDRLSAKRRNKKDITVRDLYDYVHRKMSTENPDQSPMIWGREAGNSLVIAEALFMGQNQPAVSPKTGWFMLREERKPILDLVGPSYILDPNYHFLDWNTSFEYIVAHPLGLKRGEHVATFLEKLQNYDDVQKRSNVTFRPNFVPSVDIEILELESKSFGLIVFDKIATQIIGQNGRVKAWCVHLNISSVQRKRQFWCQMEQNLRTDVNWSAYATQYDRVIGAFSEYKNLVSTLVTKIGKPEKCLDLGAGTGTVLFSLLAASERTHILAVEKNEAMLDCLLRKLDDLKEISLKKRVLVEKGDITTCLRRENDNSFDGCVMLNVLFALDYPQEVVGQVFRVLRPGGSLVLSTSHVGTDINRLFSAIQRELQETGRWNVQTERAWRDAQDRNFEMRRLINRDTLSEIKSYLTTAGFAIEEFEPGHYVGCVVVVKAVKPYDSTQPRPTLVR
jgi:ubiquinone/menaquinone biosynthesis C-methylase UbiE